MAEVRHQVLMIGLHGFLLTTTLLATAGCQKKAVIEQYPVPKTDRLLGAIIPRDDVVWFFKLNGPAAIIDKEIPVFKKLIRSVRFSKEKNEPEWDLPDDWRQIAGGGLRYATLQFGSEERPFSVSVTRLGRASQSDERLILDNLNRWRGQMCLPEIGVGLVDEYTESMKLADGKAVLMNFAGTYRPNMRRPSPPADAPPRTSPRPSTGPAELSFLVPESWKRGERTRFSKYAFVATDGTQEIKITITPAGGSVLANVKRWRNPLQLPAISDEELQKTIQSITVDDSTGSYVQLVSPKKVNPQKTVLGVIVPRNGMSWFIKLNGDSKLAAKERQNFETFVKSIKFTPASGTENGK